jgi:hypothetical protein
MAGSRKFALQFISREDIAALTREASEISGIPYVLDADEDEVAKILNGWVHALRVGEADGRLDGLSSGEYRRRNRSLQTADEG